MLVWAALAGLYQVLTQGSMHDGWAWRETDLLYMFQQGTLVGQRSVTQRNRASASRWSPLASAISARIMRSTSRLLLSSQRLHTETGQVGLLTLGSHSQVGVQIQRLHSTSQSGFASAHACPAQQGTGELEAHSCTALALSDGQWARCAVRARQTTQVHTSTCHYALAGRQLAVSSYRQRWHRYIQPLLESDTSE